MKRILATLALLLLAPAVPAQILPPMFGGSPATTQNPQPQPFSAPQSAPQPAAPIFPAPGAAPAAAAVPAPAPPGPVAPAPAPFNYSANVASDVFGASMFTGSFLQSTASVFNPDYVIAIGDQLQLRLWGAFQVDTLVMVDAQGNVFLPQVGPVRVAGVLNQDLPQVVETAMRRTFRSNVFSYVSLAAAQPVRVFVTGFVNRPGMYQGTSTDSVLRYLDQAGGIDPERGSFLDVKVLRGSVARGEFNLYDFLLRGFLPAVQLADGDVIVVQPRKSVFKVSGLAEITKRFEFTGDSIDLSRLSALAKPFPTSTHVRVIRNTGIVRNTEYFALADAGTVRLSNGDEIVFTADSRPGTIAVRVEGEHGTPQEYVLPYGTRLGVLVRQIKFTDRSDSRNLQLFRLSVKERQRQLLQASLKKLEAAVLTARSGTTEEAKLRQDEAQLMLQWVERAKNLEPLGQVVIAQAQQRDDLLLENGDILRVPVKDGLILVHGEVLFPNAVAYDTGYDIDDYIKLSGGYTQSANTSRIIVAHRDGSFDEAAGGSQIRAGDDILVLPKVDSKPRQFWKDIVQIIFQAALAAKVVLGN